MEEKKHMKSMNRNKMLRNNILFSGLLKIISLSASFLIVPLTLHYLDNESYGIWMTISSMAFWIFTFDIGLGNGMRNYLTAAISQNDSEAAQKYTSTTFLLLSIIAAIICVIAIPLIMLLDFNQILNTVAMKNQQLQMVIIMALILTLINFVVKNIGYIYIALQKYAINDLLTVGGSVMALTLIYILTNTTEGNLFYVVFTFMAMPVIVFLVGSIPLFIKYPHLRPSYQYIDINFVTTYNIAYKLFNLLIIFYTIIIAPMWNAYTDAYVKKDWIWIRRTFNKALLIWGLTILAGIVMLLICEPFYTIWVGPTITVPFSVSVAVYLFVIFFNLNNCVTYLLNGLNTIRIQIYTSVIGTVIYLTAISIYGRQWGIEGIVLSMAITYAGMSLIHLFQCKLIIHQTATGIWKK